MGMALERLAARIGNDQGRAALGGLFEISRGDRMVFGRIGADHENDFGILAFVEGRRYRAGADPLHQRRHRGGVTEPRAMIDIVGAKAGAPWSLADVSLFFRSLGRP